MDWERGGLLDGDERGGEGGLGGGKRGGGLPNTD